MLNEKKKILNFMRLLPIITILVVSFTLILLSILVIKKYFNNEIKNQEQKIVYEKIYNAKKNIKAVSALIKRTNRLVNTSFRKELRLVVEVGFNLLKAIYIQNKKFDRKIILKKIKNDLNEVRFYNNSGYYFVYDLKNKKIILPDEYKKEQVLKFDYFNYENLINRVKSEEYATFEQIDDKLVYIQYFKPLDILIGSFVSNTLVKEKIYKRLLQVVSKINLDKNLIILKTNGNVLYSKNRTLLGKNLYDKYRFIILKSQKSTEKLSKIEIDGKSIIFNYYAPLKLIILNEINIEQLRKEINKKKEDINEIVASVIKQFLAIATGFIILILLITMKLSKVLESIFDRYETALIEEKEKAQQAAKTKSEFLANMSHEIRTPLNAMFGFIKILKEKKFDEETEKYLNVIEKSGTSLLTIINDILDFSKIEANKFIIEKIEFNPKEEIDSIHELFESIAKEKNIKLEIITNLNYNIISDPTRIKQIIANLLSNAIKFTDNNKKVILNVNYDDKKEELFVEVIDEGIGIPKEKMDVIFEEFSQVDNSTTRKYGGTGLGLTISHRLVELLGGKLWVDSEVGKGSRFYFTIPAKKTTLAKEIKKEEKKIFTDVKNMHVLLVEDNKANQMFMKVVLKKMGLTFDIANNGIEAIEKFIENKYDLILMDENMPEMNGIEATKKIREYENKNNLGHTFISALTANALQGDKERFIKAGMDFYLAKPLDVEKLKEILEKINK